MEIFKEIPNWEEYKVSNLGNIISYKRSTPKLMKLKKSRNGYSLIDLCVGGINKTLQVHRLVARTFLTNYSEDLVVNHKNFNKLDNKLENLEMVTRSENSKHAIRGGKINTSGIAALGEKNHRAKYSDKLVSKLKHELKTSSIASLALQFDLKPSTIQWLCKGRV